PACDKKRKNLTNEEKVKRSAKKAKQENKGKATVSVGTGPDPEPSDTKVAKAKKPDDNKPKPEDIVETETIRGKNGAVVTRTVLKDGSVNLKRVNGSGNVTIEFDDVYDMAAAVREATRAAAQERTK